MQINFLNLNSTFDTSIYKALKAGANFDTNVSIKDYVNNESSSSEFKNKVFFTDIVSGQRISVNLSDKNLNDLQNTFGTSQVKQNQNGTYELSGEAQNLVSGWFGDIAYQRGYLEADADKNGSLDKNEFGNTRSGVGIEAYLSYENGKISVQTQAYSYDQFSNQKKYLDNLGYTPENFSHRITDFTHSITQELNNTLSKDKDKDGVLKLSELVVDKDKSESEYKSALRQVLGNQQKAEKIIGSGLKYVKLDLSGLFIDVKQMLEELEKMMKEALMKELGLAGNPDNYDLNKLQAQASSQNSSTQDTASAQTHSNLTQTDNSLTSLASSIKDNIKANLSVDIYA